jgi:hypothetical protein
MVYVILDDADALRQAAEVNRHLAAGWAAPGGAACDFDRLNKAARSVQAVDREPATL